MPKTKKKKLIKKKTLEKFVMLFGFLCFLSFAVGIARGYYPGYDWITNSLSDMGTFNYIFNWALVLAGIFLGGFLFTSFRIFVGSKYRFTESLLLICAGLLSGIGVFPLNRSASIHYFIAYSFFVLFPITLFFLSYNLSRVNIMASLFTLTCSSVFVFIMFCYIFARFFIFLGLAIPELLCLAVSCFWIFVFIFKYVAPFNDALNRKKTA